MRILLADDCDATRFLAKRVLARAGHDVEMVSDGGAALRCITEGPRYYDLIVLDEDMPVLTGLLVLERVRAQGNDIAVVIHSDHDRSEPAARLGATFVLKDALCTALAEHIGQAPHSDPPP